MTKLIKQTGGGGAGSVGPQGPAGPTGPEGPEGPMGPQGLKGDTGNTGAQGPQGVPGNDGDDGAPGVAGATGSQGPAGNTGPEGPEGPQGEVGPQGIQGNPGADGIDGAQGDTGPEGPPGVFTPTYAALANGTLALAFGTPRHAVKVTPTAAGAFTTTVPPAGSIVNLMVVTSGVVSFSMTFGAGFRSVPTLATGTTSARIFLLQFVSDGTQLYQVARTAAMVA